MPTDFRSIAAALANDHARRAFAMLALGESEQAVIGDLGASRATKALAALRRAGLIEADAANLQPAVFRDLLAADASAPRATGVDRFVSGGRIDRYPVQAAERATVLRWALERVIPLEIVLSEANVTARLATVTGDPAMLRRFLVDAGMMRRTASGSEYTRARNSPSSADPEALADADVWGEVPWSAGTWTNRPVDAREVDLGASVVGVSEPVAQQATVRTALDGTALDVSALDVSALDVTAAEGSDAWRTTAYGFVHDTEHALLAPFVHGSAVEVSFVADFDAQFDQAGVFVRIGEGSSGERNWVKAGVEFSDGMPQVGAVVTREASDWSVAPVPEWAGRRVTVRASWDLDALTIRARVDDEPFRLVRVVPLEPRVAASAGPFLCAPTRAGLTVRFTRWSVGEVDAALH